MNTKEAVFNTLPQFNWDMEVLFNLGSAPNRLGSFPPHFNNYVSALSYPLALPLLLLSEPSLLLSFIKETREFSHSFMINAYTP
jgi:hypothetical protein